jgi:hypothetical protein
MIVRGLYSKIAQREDKGVDEGSDDEGPRPGLKRSTLENSMSTCI